MHFSSLSFFECHSDCVIGLYISESIAFRHPDVFVVHGDTEDLVAGCRVEGVGFAPAGIQG